MDRRRSRPADRVRAGHLYAVPRAEGGVIVRPAPHWPRKDGWWERSVPYSLELQDATGLRVGLQEEARQSYQGQSWPLEAYVSVEREACEAGLLLYTQHTEAGFRPWDGPLREQLDPVTRAALEAQGAAGCGS